MRIAIIGGGAAGLMCAATIVEKNKNPEVCLIEKNSILGHKVMISGGGRCNVTTGIKDLKQVLAKYPRGKNFLRHAMYNFPPDRVMRWFDEHEVKLKTEEDFRVFPKSNDGKDIVKVFEHIFQNDDVKLLLKTKVKNVQKSGDKFLISLENGENLEVEKVVITTGGQAYRQTGSTGDGYFFAENLGHKITKLAPSLNAFVLAEKWVLKLAGVSFEKAKLRIVGKEKFDFTGAFVFTHHGISGPAVFAISSLAAYELGNLKEPVNLFVDFFPEKNYENLTKELNNHMAKNPKKFFVNTLDFLGPLRVMQMLCADLKIDGKKVNAEVSNGEINKAIEWLKNLKLTVKGYAPGEEFVTAGGVDLKEVDSKTMQSKICPGLYFAGEILDIDGFTGGFNLQAAWATGRLAGESLCC